MRATCIFGVRLFYAVHAFRVELGQIRRIIKKSIGKPSIKIEHDFSQSLPNKFQVKSAQCQQLAQSLKGYKTTAARSCALPYRLLGVDRVVDILLDDVRARLSIKVPPNCHTKRADIGRRHARLSSVRAPQMPRDDTRARSSWLWC